MDGRSHDGDEAVIYYARGVLVVVILLCLDVDCQVTFLSDDYYYSSRVAHHHELACHDMKLQDIR